MELELTYTINAPTALVWESITDPTHIEQWSGGPAVMPEQAGEDFSLWGGEIYGQLTKVVDHEIIEQDWYTGDWDESSHVVITFTPKKDSTIVDIKHSNIPEDAIDGIKEGWDENFMEPFIEYVEDLHSVESDDMDDMYFED